MRVFAFAAMFALGCYSPDIPPGKFACTQDVDCPEPYVCRPTSGGSRCVDSTPSAAACAGEGVKLSDNVWGCKGELGGSGTAAALCRTGWHPCESRDAAALNLGAACDDIQGFFAARIRVERVESQGQGAWRTFSVDCDIGMSVDAPFGLLGCGLEPGARRVGQREQCPPLPMAVQCGTGMGNAWSCNGDGLDRAAYTGKVGGVLCCKD